MFVEGGVSSLGWAWIISLAASVVFAVVVAGCGGGSQGQSTGQGQDGGAGQSGSVGGAGAGGGPGGVAIRVGSQLISMAAVRHWMPIEATLSTEGNPKGPVAAGVVPDPPAYTACIAHLEALASAKPEPVKPNRTVLKRECEARENTVREHILNILVTDLWVRGEAEAHQIRVSDDEVRQRIKENLPAQFGNETGFRKYLAYTGLTMGDELELYRKNLLSTKLLENVLARKNMSTQEKTRAYAEFVTRWVAKTDCNPDYVIPDCKQYKGPIAPG